MKELQTLQILAIFPIFQILETLETLHSIKIGALCHTIERLKKTLQNVDQLASVECKHQSIDIISPHIFY